MVCQLSIDMLDACQLRVNKPNNESIVRFPSIVTVLNVCNNNFNIVSCVVTRKTIIILIDFSQRIVKDFSQ